MDNVKEMRDIILDAIRIRFYYFSKDKIRFAFWGVIPYLKFFLGVL